MEPVQLAAILAGAVLVASMVSVEVGISADDFKKGAYQELLGAIEGMEFEPRP